MAELSETNIRVLRDCRSAGFAAAQINRLENALAGELGSVGPLLDERRQAGRVRRCHGDLHLRNICLVDGQPMLFDCVEFSEELASIDVLYDLAFLLMDLGHRGHQSFANLVLNRYLDLTGEDDGLALMPLFLSMRAVIRAHVTATMAEHGWGPGDPLSAVAEARRYPTKPKRRSCRSPRGWSGGGLSGSGKSVLPPGRSRPRPDPRARILRPRCPAAALPAQSRRPCRRRLRGQSPPGLPVLSGRRRHARRLFGRDRRAIARAGGGALRFAAAAAAAGSTGLPARCVGRDVRPVARRRGDASDASAEILRHQLARNPGARDWIGIDAGGDRDATLAASRRALTH
jgi:hypothetical protein